MIDLHTHTTASDGQYLPSELVRKACDAGVTVLAVTDHDTVSGLDEASREAKKAGITFVRGIELAVAWPTGEFHLLGLGLTNTSPRLCDMLIFLHEKRKERNMQIIKKMQESGFSLSYEEMLSLFPNREIGRPHFAEYLVQKNIVKTNQQAFEKYFAKGRPWYVARIGGNLDEAVQAIYDSGGIPVIAHPLSLHVSWSQFDAILDDIHERGVEGIEAYHPGARLQDCKRLEQLARAHGMFVTAGSDFHGEKIRTDRKLGHTSDGKKIDDSFYYDELLPHISNFLQVKNA
ncbi:MAG: PHP domain-containing protein [Treponema sp.]|nr:PHP domain-containing protein [Treponema sp.]